MLTQEEKDAIAVELDSGLPSYADAVHALDAIQKSRGWISEKSLRDVAEHLGMTPAELDGVATFYNRIYRSPVGRHVVLLCDSVSCWVMGYENLFRHLLDRLGITAFGETTKDGLFTLLPSACLGACDHAPAMMIDRKLYGDLTLQRIDEIVDRYKEAAGASNGQAAGQVQR